MLPRAHGSPSFWNGIDLKKKQDSSEVVQRHWENWEKVLHKRCEHDPNGHSGRAPDVLCEGGRRSQKVKLLGMKAECPDSRRVDEAGCKRLQRSRTEQVKTWSTADCSPSNQETTLGTQPGQLCHWLWARLEPKHTSGTEPCDGLCPTQLPPPSHTVCSPPTPFQPSDKSDDEGFFLVCSTLSALADWQPGICAASSRYLTVCWPRLGIQFRMLCQLRCRGRYNIQMVGLRDALREGENVEVLPFLSLSLSLTHSYSLS